MTPQSQIKALAELAGIVDNNYRPDYLHSYDAIIPLIQKQTETMRYNIFLQVTKIAVCPTFDVFKANPSQLSEALLRATNKWKDE